MKKINKNKMIAVVCIALAVVILAAVLIWRLTDSKEPTPTDPGGSSQATGQGSTGGDNTVPSTGTPSTGITDPSEEPVYFPMYLLEDTELRAGPGEEYDPILPLSKGTQVLVVPDTLTDTRWTQILHAEQFCYVPFDILGTTPPEENTDPSVPPYVAPVVPGETEPSQPTEPATQPTEPVHQHSYYAEVVKPVCNEDGYTEYTCSCGDTYRDDFVSELGHKWTEWTVTKEATTSQPGSKTRSCTVCGYVDTVAIPNHVHSYTEETIPATCEKYGYTLRTCSCGRSYEHLVIEDALGHSWSEWEFTVQPTTSSTGERTRFCSRCSKVETEVVPALDPETGEAYESYIDPRITVKEYYNNTGYRYGDFAVVDYRTWGDPPSIWINDDETWTVVYYDQNGTRVEVLVEVPPEGYIRDCRILDDGTYLVTLVGGYNH